MTLIKVGMSLRLLLGLALETQMPILGLEICTVSLLLKKRFRAYCLVCSDWPLEKKLLLVEVT